jgi:Putative zinc-finger
MTTCRSAGAVRAWLDRELPPAEMEQMAAHLSECGGCNGLRGELEARAAHVGALIQALDGIRVDAIAVDASILNAGKPRIAKPNPGNRWVPVAVALAAGLALAFYLSPKRQAPRAASSAQPAFATVANAPVPAAAPALTIATPRRQHRSAAKPAEFIALDSEPFESGVILRVDVPDTNIQADVVFSPDGRARAYRLIQASNRNRNKERSNE